MKSKPNPRDWEKVARRVLCWLYEAWERAEKAEARAEIAEAERDQLRAQLESLHEQMKRIQGGIDKAAVSILETLYNKT